MAVLRNGSKCSHTTCMLRFFTVSRLALNLNLIFEIGSSIHPELVFLLAQLNPYLIFNRGPISALC
jgi:hypothetical protein